MKKTTKPEEPQMHTVSFQIREDDFQVLQAIAARFLQGCFHGDRPMDIRDLSRLALLAKKEDMAWVLEAEKPVAAGRVIYGPWNSPRNAS